MQVSRESARWFVYSRVFVAAAQGFLYSALAVAPIMLVVPLLQLSLVFRFLFAYLFNPHHELFGAVVVIGSVVSIVGACAVSINTDLVVGMLPLPPALATLLRAPLDRGPSVPAQGRRKLCHLDGLERQDRIAHAHGFGVGHRQLGRSEEFFGDAACIERPLARAVVDRHILVMPVSVRRCEAPRRRTCTWDNRDSASASTTTRRASARTIGSLRASGFSSARPKRPWTRQVPTTKGALNLAA